MILSFSADLAEDERAQLEESLRKLLQKMLDVLHIEAGGYPCDEGDKPLKVNW